MRSHHTLGALAVGTVPGTRTRGLAILGLFVALQAADVVLTLTGVSRFGLVIEANPLLATAMRLFGAASVLIAAKTVAIALATLLTSVQAYLPLALLTVLYVFGALVPWMMAVGG